MAKELKNNDILNIIKEHKSICWYPSAGSDFRPLLYLSDAYYKKHEELTGETDTFPDLFILTDYSMNKYMNFTMKEDTYRVGNSNIRLFPRQEYHIQSQFDKIYSGTLEKGDLLYEDGYTKITVKEQKKIIINGVDACKELLQDNINIPLNYGQGYYMTLEVNSHHSSMQKLGVWETHVIYLYTENTSFAKNFLLNNQVNIDYIVKVRYGNSMGGGSMCAGYWLVYLAEQLNVKYYVSDLFAPDRLPANYNLEGTEENDGDAKALRYIRGDSDTAFSAPKLSQIYYRDWYYDQPVGWYRVER